MVSRLSSTTLQYKEERLVTTGPHSVVETVTFGKHLTKWVPCRVTPHAEHTGSCKSLNYTSGTSASQKQSTKTTLDKSNTMLSMSLPLPSHVVPSEIAKGGREPNQNGSVWGGGAGQFDTF